MPKLKLTEELTSKDLLRLHDDEAQQVIVWNFVQCLELGLTIDQSLKLVRVPNFSWHAADDLIREHPEWPLDTIVDELT